MDIIEKGGVDVLKKWAGLVSLILGVIFIISPVSGVTAISILTGLVLTALGVWMLLNGLMARKYMEVSILWMVFSLIALAVGLILAFRVVLINQIAGAWFYVTGVLLIVAGVMILSAGYENYIKRNAGIISAIFGLIYIIAGFLAFNPVFIGVLVGLILVLHGVMVLRSP